MFFYFNSVTSTTYAVRWVEATGNGDLHHERLFASLSDANSWLTDAEAEDDHGYLPVLFEHCGPRTVSPR